MTHRRRAEGTSSYLEAPFLRLIFTSFDRHTPVSLLSLISLQFSDPIAIISTFFRMRTALSHVVLHYPTVILFCAPHSPTVPSYSQQVNSLQSDEPSVYFCESVYRDSDKNCKLIRISRPYNIHVLILFPGIQSLIRSLFRFLHNLNNSIKWKDNGDFIVWISLYCYKCTKQWTRA